MSISNPNKPRYSVMPYSGYGFVIVDSRNGQYVRDKGIIMVRVTREQADKLCDSLEKKSIRAEKGLPERPSDPSKPDRSPIDVKDVPPKIICHNCGQELTDIFGSDEIHLKKSVNGWSMEEDPVELNCTKCLNPLDTKRPEIQEIMKAVGLL